MINDRHIIKVEENNTLRYNSYLIKKGDIILSTVPAGKGFLAGGIRFFQKMHSKDKDAFYTHCMFVSEVDHFNHIYKIFDTSVKIEERDFFENYSGHPCTVVRVKIAEDSKIDEVCRILINKDSGKRYPFLRLFLHMFGLADNIHWDRLVCSERVAKYLHLILREHRIFSFERYYGWTPDNIYDFTLDRQDIFEFVYEGIC
jgi:hypothetical protein